ncbi:Gfo/Idh/MocA family protein [Solicola sp. PLA-1-18]|uniref:Gfo/Idh/MocA family protein n=1 Tax=Solicola sp. PLA-1-18 TaxID=3380532 RepID=UPI003B7FDE38
MSKQRELRIGVAGAGAIVRLSHLPAITRVPGVRAVALADPDAGRVNQLADEYEATAYPNYTQMIAEADLDAVLVAAPNHLHLDIVAKAAARGLHVFTEKPVAHNLEDARAIEAACDEAGVVTQTGFNQRYREPVQLAKQGLEAGMVGDVLSFRSVYSESYAVYPSATGYRYDLAQSGGASILDLAIHRIDLARHLVGDIVEVCATVDHRTIPHAADDNVFLLLRFDNGATGVISSDRFSPQVSNATDLYGPVGTIHLSTETRNPFQSVPMAFSSQLPASELPEPLANAEWPSAWWLDYTPGAWVSVSPTRGNPYDAEWTAFAAAVAGHDTLSRPTIHDGVRAQEVVTAAYRSVREHGWVSLPLTDAAEPVPTYE